MLGIGWGMLKGDKALAGSSASYYSNEESLEKSNIYINANALNLTTYSEKIEEPYSPEHIKKMVTEEELKNNIEDRKKMIFTTFVIVGVMFIVTAGLLMYKLSKRMRE